MTVNSGRVLLVEGKQDLRVIPELIEANGVPWGTNLDQQRVEHGLLLLTRRCRLQVAESRRSRQVVVPAAGR
jgi:hypothetical protein